MPVFGNAFIPLLTDAPLEKSFTVVECGSALNAWILPGLLNDDRSLMALAPKSGIIDLVVIWRAARNG